DYRDLRRRQARRSAPKAAPSNAREPGSEVEITVGVSEKCFVTIRSEAPPTRVAESRTVIFVVPLEKFPVALEAQPVTPIQAIRVDAPATLNISWSTIEPAPVTLPATAREASVIGSLAGAVMLKPNG